MAKVQCQTRGVFMNLTQSLISFLGRALLSIIFIASGTHKILDWQFTEQYFIQELTDWLALSVGNSALQNIIELGISHSSFLLLLAVCFELIGGLFIFLGLWVRLGSALLIIFLIPTTIVFHHFWQLQEPDREMQMIDFMKNVGILGGLLTLLALGKGHKREKVHVRGE
jgi:putative oxidoreductase